MLSQQNSWQSRVRLGAFAFLFLGVTGTAVAAEEMKSYALTVKDGHFNLETIEVAAGKKFKLVVQNDGVSAEEFESHDLKREKVIPAGQKAEFVLGPLKAGTYKFVGEFHEDTAKGQIIAK